MSYSPYSLENKNHILDMERYNGRINVVEMPDPKTQFQMYEKISVKNKSTEYRDSLVGIIENNVLAQVYFSEGNIQILQNGLRAGVYKMSNNKYVIPPQNIDQLKIIMRSFYLQYAEHKNTDITEQVERLNKMVLDYTIPSVYNEAMGYMKYLQDQSTLVQPLEMPQLNDRDFKQLEYKKWF